MILESVSCSGGWHHRPRRASIMVIRLFEQSEVEEGQEGRRSHRYGWFIIIFPITAEREDTPVLIMMSRRKAFTVWGLMFIRFAIALLFRPCSKYSNTSRSRSVKLNCWETFDKETNPEGPLSSRTAMLGREGSFACEPTRKVRQK